MLGTLAMLGSSPRMRGKRLAVPYDTPTQRLIPAHAGKTGKQLAADFATQAHPRACGENYNVLFLFL